MKSLFLIMLSFAAGALNFTDDEVKDLEKVAKAVNQFSTSVDARDVKSTDQVLHTNFRSVVNRLFGSEEVSIMDKSLYLKMLGDGKIGGDKRNVTIHTINLEGNNAVVKASFEGAQLRFSTFMQLVKDPKGNWTIISDMPRIEKK